MAATAVATAAAPAATVADGGGGVGVRGPDDDDVEITRIESGTRFTGFTGTRVQVLTKHKVKWKMLLMKTTLIGAPVMCAETGRKLACWCVGSALCPYVCPQTSVSSYLYSVSSYLYMCSHTSIYVMCPHISVYVSSCLDSMYVSGVSGAGVQAVGTFVLLFSSGLEGRR